MSQLSNEFRAMADAFQDVEDQNPYKLSEGFWHATAHLLGCGNGRDWQFQLNSDLSKWPEARKELITMKKNVTDLLDTLNILLGEEA